MHDLPTKLTGFQSILVAQTTVETIVKVLYLGPKHRSIKKNIHKMDLLIYIHLFGFFYEVEDTQSQ